MNLQFKISVFTFCSVALLSLSVLAQNDKATEKEWAKKLKSLKPLDYKKMTEDLAKYKEESQAAKNEAMDYKSQLAAKEAELQKLREEMENRTSGPSISEKDEVDITSRNSKLDTKGLIFKVQIGAFKNKDLTKYFENNKNFSGEVDQDGTKKYTLGYFNDYWEADNFKKYLREMGVKDAWLVAYKGGVRQNMKEVLEALNP